MSKPDITKYKGIIFDLDGTLIDSNDIWEQIDVMTVKQYGRSVSGSVLLKKKKEFISTCTLPDIYLVWAQYLIDTYNIKNVSAKELRAYQIQCGNDFLRKISYKANADKLLLALKNTGIKLALATLSGDDVIKVLKNENPNIKNAADFNKVFDQIISVNMVKRRKPDPEAYLLAAELLGLKPSECLIIEDSLVGAEAALNAGADVCIIYDKHSDRNRDELRKITPYHIKTFDEIIVQNI